MEPAIVTRAGRPGISRRSLLGAIGALGVAGGLGARWPRMSTIGTAPPDDAADELDELAENVVSGGPPKDGIPAIDEPVFVAADDVEFLSDDDAVFGLARDGDAHAYPQLVLVWHEIVNDRFADDPVSVTYCPLTGSTVAFRHRASGDVANFGTTGKLVNSNLLMYDRETDSEWPQLLGQAITGPRRGEKLEEIPVDWTTWSRWRQAHPDTVVLTTDTGFLRSYGTDPYGSYVPLGGYYENDRLLFRVLHEDDRLPRKEVVIGVKHGSDRLAVPKAALRERGAIEATVGGERVVVRYDEELDEGRAFLADETRVTSLNVMWFAWFAFFPETQLIV